VLGKPGRRLYDDRREAATMKPERTVYESQRRRSVRRTRRLLVGLALVVVCVAAVGGVLLVFERGAGARTDAASSASPSPAPLSSPAAVRTVSLDAVKVHRGETARLRYRIEDPLGRAWTAKLQVLDAAGEAVKNQGLGDAVKAGATHVVEFPARIPVGEYSYVVHVEDAQGSAETTSTPARLTVLKALPPAFPGARAIAAAFKWARGRGSTTGVAVVDSRGALHGWHEHVRFTSASLAKAMLLVAYLRSHPHAAALDGTATTMIEESDNACAYAIQGAVGMSGLKKVAALADMRDFQAGGSWIDCKVSAADQARFFYSYLSYVPASRRSFARKLLNGIIPIQRWGIPAAAGPDGWKPFFKSGWLYLDNVLMVQAAWVEKGAVKWSVAVMTDKNPTKSYGWDTQKGVTGLLLGHQPTAAYLARVLE
jgi:hypothetical protein